MSLQSVLEAEGLQANIVKGAVDAGWSLNAFKHVVDTSAELEQALPEIFGEVELSRLQKSQIRAAWAGVWSSSAPSAAATPTATTSDPSSWVESFAPKLTSTKLLEMKQQFKTDYTSEILSPNTMPSLRLISLAAHQESKKEYRWIPWKHRLTEESAADLQISRPQKQPRLEVLGISNLLLDDPPTIEVNDHGMGISGVQRLLAVHDVALAMVGSAHLARLKAYSNKFVHLLSQRYDPSSGLRAPRILEAQQADCKLWQQIYALVSDKGWKLNDALYEFTEIRGEMASLLASKGKSEGKDKGPSKGKGASKGASGSWVKDVVINGETKQLCTQWQSGKCSRGANCAFIHACAFPKGDGTACMSKFHGDSVPPALAGGINATRFSPVDGELASGTSVASASVEHIHDYESCLQLLQRTSWPKRGTADRAFTSAASVDSGYWNFGCQVSNRSALSAVSVALPEVCKQLNTFLQHLFPGETWIATLPTVPTRAIFQSAWEPSQEVRFGSNRTKAPGQFMMVRVGILARIGVPPMLMMFSSISEPPDAWVIRDHQPICLNALHAVASFCGDPDTSLFAALKDGVPTGYLHNIPSSNCFWPNHNEGVDDIPLSIHLQNWRSATVEPEVTRKLLQEELDQGFCFKFHGSLEDAEQRWPLGVAIGKLSVVRAPGRSERLCLDNSVCGTNANCVVPEKQHMPSVRDVIHSYPIRDHRQIIKAQGTWSLRKPEPTFTKTETVPVDSKGPSDSQATQATASPANGEEAAKTEDGKTKKPQDGAQAAKKQCQSQRAVPETLTIQAIPTDGNCLFGAFAAGLALVNGKAPLHPALLRAQVTQHYKKYQQTYEEQWHGELPDTTKSSDFSEYITAVGRDASWGSTLEIRALARLFDVRYVRNCRPPCEEVGLLLHQEVGTTAAVQSGPTSRLPLFAIRFQVIRPTGFMLAKVTQALLDAVSLMSSLLQASEAASQVMLDRAVAEHINKVDVPAQAAASFARAWKKHGWHVFLSRSEPRHLLLVAAYGFPGDLCSTNIMLEELSTAFRIFGGSFAMFGDMNQVAEEGSLARLAMGGALRLLDDARPTQLRPTNPTRTRRIDFGVADASVFATELWHADGLCDHVSVGYQLDLHSHFEGFTLPRRAPVEEASPSEVALRFDRLWQADAFAQALSVGDSNRAWYLLSQTAEQALCPTANASSVFPRCEPCVQGLRRLSNRLRELIRTPRREEEASSEVQALLEKYQAQERAAAITSWRRQVQMSSSRQISWVKARAEQACAIEQAPASLHKAISAIHPTAIIKHQGQAWTKLWTADPEATFDAPVMRDIVQAVPQREAWSDIIELTSEDLQACARRMARKAVTATRPIGLLQTAWRLGAKALCTRLKPWINTWVSHAAFGAAPGFSAADAHYRIYGALKRRVKGFVVQDLKGFFDHLHLDSITPLLSRLGAPPSLLMLLQSFYKGGQRLFKAQGYVASAWVPVSRGLVQGDPLSPLLALVVGHFWAMGAGFGSPLKLSLDKVVWRLRYLKLLPVPLKRKTQLLWTLAYSSVYWCAGVAAPAPEVFGLLRHEALAIFNSSFPPEVPQFLKHTLLGWNTDPDFLLQYTALRKAAKLVTHRPAWLDEVPLTEGVDPWTVQLPTAQLALEQLGWQALPQGAGIQRLDSTGTWRQLWFGFDSFKTLRHWLEDRAAERLFSPAHDVYPPAPAAVTDDGEAFAQALKLHLQTSGSQGVFVATDGSSCEDVGGSAAVLLSGSTHLSFGIDDDSEDQTSFRAEVLALRFVAQTLQLCALAGSCGTLYVLSDCQAALQALKNPASSSLPLLATQTADAFAHAQNLGLTVHLKWCPAHGRSEEWKPDFPLTAPACRALNESADAKAKEVMHLRRRGSARALWHNKHAEVSAWSTGAIKLSACAGDAYAAALTNRKVARLQLLYDDEDDAEGHL
ncbi:unnamed protein product [Symbiodinium necroappetens]|uniref:LINE-1 reverse transcriptase-like n=1 Tax=Symbiodinium necroappetens TaxID=1628268 RepID=A0A812MQ13_9DINO|nr:unnamed protein product [Symbiodinium necroappetens]